MLKKRLIPTELIGPAERPPIKIVSIKPNYRFRNGVLLFRLVRFALSIQWARLVRKVPPAVVASRVRAFIEDLGGLWIKAGQVISLRTDLLSPEMVDELQQLQHRAFGFSPEVSKQVIEESLGKPIAAVFDVFEEHPFAAASISQVHRARLRFEGTWVAVKVQRPDIANIFARDLKLLAFITGLFARVEALSFIKWEGLIKELKRITDEETDYRYEEANLRRIRKIVLPHKVYVPKPFIKYCSRKVLVMEFVHGVLMSDYLQTNRSDPDRLKAWRKENNVKPRKVGSRLMRTIYRQMFEDNLFHGDLHPGNIVLLRNSRFALIDLGTIGNLEAKFLNNYWRQSKAFSDGDFSKAVDLFLLMADSIPVFHIPDLKSEMVELYRAWEARTHLRGLTYYEKSITGGLAEELPAITRKYKVNATWQFLRVSRALSTLDASLTVLLEYRNPRKILKQYFREAQTRNLRSLLTGGILRSARNAISDFSELASSAVESARMAEIKLYSIQTKAAYFFHVLFRSIRVGVFAVGGLLLYHLVHHTFPTLISGPGSIEAFRGVAEKVPSHPLAIDLVGLIVIVWLYWASGKIKNRLAAETIRRPDGTLDG
ncbi:MAG: ABC1 kinase family protein [Pyrinomonadaceae bacterium]